MDQLLYQSGENQGECEKQITKGPTGYPIQWKALIETIFHHLPEW
jgi:hypothetical protein